jgi:hypothetical protein
VLGRNDQEAGDKLADVEARLVVSVNHIDQPGFRLELLEHYKQGPPLLGFEISWASVEIFDQKIQQRRDQGM